MEWIYCLVGLAIVWASICLGIILTLCAAASRADDIAEQWHKHEEEERQLAEKDVNCH